MVRDIYVRLDGLYDYTLPSGAFRFASPLDVLLRDIAAATRKHEIW